MLADAGSVSLGEEADSTLVIHHMTMNDGECGGEDVARKVPEVEAVGHSIAAAVVPKAVLAGLGSDIPMNYFAKTPFDQVIHKQKNWMAMALHTVIDDGVLDQVNQGFHPRP